MNDPFSPPSESGLRGERVNVRRSKDGRPYVHDLEKGKEALFTRCTTFIDCLEDKSALSKWSQRIMLTGVRVSKELRGKIMDLPENLDPDAQDVKKRLAELAEGLLEVGGEKRAAQKGTDLHELTEAADEGRELPVLSDADSADLSAYLEALHRHRLVPAEVEVFVVNDYLKAAGTFDRVFLWYLDGWESEPLRVVGDLKTGRVDYGQGKLAMQLALYANSSRYDPEAPTERGSLDVSREVGIIVHLPAGKGEARVYSVDLALGYEGLLLAQKVREWRSRTSRVNAGVLNDLAYELTP